MDPFENNECTEEDWNDCKFLFANDAAPIPITSILELEAPDIFDFEPNQLNWNAENGSTKKIIGFDPALISDGTGVQLAHGIPQKEDLLPCQKCKCQCGIKTNLISENAQE